MSCHSNKISSQAKFVCSLLTACKISNKSNKRFMRYCTFIFSMSCSIASVTSYLSGIEAKNLQNGDVHIAQIPDFEMESRETFGALRSVMARFFLHFSRSFIRAKLFFDRRFPLKRGKHSHCKDHEGLDASLHTMYVHYYYLKLTDQIRP